MRACCSGRCGPTTGRRGARSGCAAAIGSSVGSRCPKPGSADPALDYEAFRARCAAWERQRHFDAAYGFGLFLADGRFAGEVSLGSVQRGPFQMGYIGYWIDEACGGNEYVPEGVVLLIRYAFETLRMHRLEAAIVPRNLRAGGSPRSSDCATKERRSGSCRSRAPTRITSATRSRSRNGANAAASSWRASSRRALSLLVVVGALRRSRRALR